MIQKLSLALLFVLVACTPQRAPKQPSAGAHYVCPPCGLSCDKKVFDHPGKCPYCRMTLVEESARPHLPSVAVLLFDNVEIIDFTGPWEVFGAAGFEVYSVAASKSPVVTSMGMTIVPQYSFKDAPAPDVLLIPGGYVDAAISDPATSRWVKETSKRATRTLSVCNGAFILASVGLLDGLSATTTYGLLGDLRAQFPKVKVVDDVRFVDNGTIITTAGLSAGIDGALHTVEKLKSPGDAQQIALQLEYRWEPEGGFVRAQLADKQLPALTGDWSIVQTSGTRTAWSISLRGAPSLSASQLLALAEQAFAGRAWMISTEQELLREGSFRGLDGAIWSARLQVVVDGGAPLLTIEIKK